MDVHFSSKTDMWATPQDTFDAQVADLAPDCEAYEPNKEVSSK